MKHIGRGFTLIELLIVITIIVILAGLLVPALLRVRLEGEKMATKSFIQNVDMAIKTYKTDWAKYPPEGVAGDTTALYGALSYSGLIPGGGRGPYMEISTTQVPGAHDYDKDDGGAFELCDYWKVELIYDLHNPEGADILAAENEHNTATFDLVSYGPDGKPGDGGADILSAGADGTDDIGNWED